MMRNVDKDEEEQQQQREEKQDALSEPPSIHYRWEENPQLFSVTPCVPACPVEPDHMRCDTGAQMKHRL